jgi:hypothetical protein
MGLGAVYADNLGWKERASWPWTGLVKTSLLCSLNDQDAFLVAMMSMLKENACRNPSCPVLLNAD